MTKHRILWGNLPVGNFPTVMSCLFPIFIRVDSHSILQENSQVTDKFMGEKIGELSEYTIHGWYGFGFPLIEISEFSSQLRQRLSSFHGWLPSLMKKNSRDLLSGVKKIKFNSFGASKLWNLLTLPTLYFQSKTHTHTNMYWQMFLPSNWRAVEIGHLLTSKKKQRLATAGFLGPSYNIVAGIPWIFRLQKFQSGMIWRIFWFNIHSKKEKVIRWCQQRSEVCVCVCFFREFVGLEHLLYLFLNKMFCRNWQIPRNA